ncbi:QacE family quaternary ammonium compound efflux SMR transporter [Marinococcus halophilus]|uniref:QacE family quaternary ammonium compound efflux SMR transporter n=1 Tax=Marinococcus halophilus TaxID=1371 RepID=A0A510Y6I2_MARHA|nr:multidrug efflux SMR transporter [Marinococcus halophilus]OZT80614.1 QacE family quaternary ammonium compound efflux SMR transporter [Marinococcus halophilus]GEK58972.1 QacE family quaternary ammonium compound efflux SMR transporter [Marinococcus halophilus]
MRAALLLLAAILFEVVASTSLKLSEGFTNLIPSLTVFIAFISAFFFLSLALKSIPLSVAYAIWAGLGTALTAGAGIVLFQESFGWMKAIGLFLVISGLILLHVKSGRRNRKGKYFPRARHT